MWSALCSAKEKHLFGYSCGATRLTIMHSSYKKQNAEP